MHLHITHSQRGDHKGTSSSNVCRKIIDLDHLFIEKRSRSNNDDNGKPKNHSSKPLTKSIGERGVEWDMVRDGK